MAQIKLDADGCIINSVYKFWRFAYGWPYMEFISDPMFQDESGTWRHIWKRLWFLSVPRR